MSGKVLLRGKSKDRLYTFPTTSRAQQSFLTQQGHPSYQTVQHIVSKISLPYSSNKIPGICTACQQGKIRRLPFLDSQSKFNGPLDLIFSNVWGPSPKLFQNVNKYYVAFVDHFSKYTWLYPISAKSDVYKVFCSFQKLVECQFNCKIKYVQTNWGGEYRSLNNFFPNIGIQHIVLHVLIPPNKMGQ